ncbi:MAG TPA: hypothetical protein VME63_05420 [Dyella sp.]|uniref:hypothetical protein n=1 Tax=Dyella sp. TaxID=1869338 RepID=UPI002C9118C4|nr:hypothetical protein [Dyella sp.]HTV84821.1 hypothetical protein [Dyella sp.]
MIENSDVAKQVSELMLDYSRRLDSSIALVRDSCDAEEFKGYRRAVGKVLGEIYLEVLTPLYQKHPDLKPPGMD